LYIAIKSEDTEALEVGRYRGDTGKVSDEATLFVSSMSPLAVPVVD